MSTADSQVLACTAAPDDIKPEWREDKDDKKVTLYVASLLNDDFHRGLCPW